MLIASAQTSIKRFTESLSLDQRTLMKCLVFDSEQWALIFQVIAEISEKKVPKPLTHFVRLVYEGKPTKLDISDLENFILVNFLIIDIETHPSKARILVF